MKSVRLIYSIFFLIPLLFTSCYFDFDDNDDVGFVGGSIISEKRYMPSFELIDQNSAANITIVQSQNYMVEIIAPRSALPFIETEVFNNRLIISSSRVFQPRKPVEIIVYAPVLSEIELSGVGNAYLDEYYSDFPLKLSLLGVGNVELSGRLDQLIIHHSGAGNLNAYDMLVENCDVYLDGVGNIEVFVREYLYADITGAGNIYFRGRPFTEHIITGLGRLIDDN